MLYGEGVMSGKQRGGEKRGKGGRERKYKGMCYIAGAASCSVTGGVFTEPSEEESQTRSHPLTPGRRGWSPWETAGAVSASRTPPACAQASPHQWRHGDGVAPATDAPSLGTSGAVVGILWLGIKGQSTCVKPKTQAVQT